MPLSTGQAEGTRLWTAREGAASGHGTSGSHGTPAPAQPSHAGHHYVGLGVASALSA